MHFGEFNPLDVLAAAASLHSPGHGEGADESQSSDGEGDGEEGTEDGINAHNYSPTSSLGCGLNTSDSVSDKTFSSIIENPHCATFVDPIKSPVDTTDHKVMPRVVKVLSNNGRLTEKLDADDKLVCSPKETCTMTGTTTTGTKDCATKTVTILRVKKTQNVDHSYAVYSKLEKSRMEDDEGYCSRSSLGSPGQCWKSDSEMMDPDVLDGRDSECVPKSPYLVLPAGQSVKSPEALSPCPSAGHGDGSTTGLKSPTMPEIQVNTSDITVVDGQNRSSPSNKKCTKIVIVSRDANLRKYFSSGDTEPSMAEQQNNSAAKQQMTETSESEMNNHKDETVAAQGISPRTISTRTSAKGDVENKTCVDVSGEDDKKDLTEESSQKGSLIAVLPDVNSGHQCDISEADAVIKEKSYKLHLENSSLKTDSDKSESDVNGSKFKKCDPLEAGSSDASEEILSDEVKETVNVSMNKQDSSHSPAVFNVPLKSEHKQGSDGEFDKKTMMTPVTSVSDESTGHSGTQRMSLPVVTSGSAVKPADELKMQSDEVQHSLLGSGSEKDKDSPSTSDIITTVSSVQNKTGLVCIMSTTASDVVSNPAVMSPNHLHGAKVSSPNQCNKYIIQDDVPPVSKYGEGTVQNSKTDTFASLLAPTCKTLEPNTKQCSTKPRFVTGNKESFVLLRLSNLSTKSPKSGLVTFSPGVKSPVPTSCVVPVLVNTGSSLPHSLLSSPAKSSSTGVSGSQANTGISPAGITQSAKLVSPSLSSCLLKKTELGPKEDTTSVTTAAIPRSWSSLLSSHKLLSGSPLFPIQPLVASQESCLDKNHDSVDSSVKTVTAPDGDESHTSGVCDTAGNVKPRLDRSTLVDPALSSVSCFGQKAASYEGRLTPLGFAAAAADSNGGSTGNINIKISGGVVVDVQQEKGIRDLKNKSACSIGQVGSLTWQNVNPPVMDTAARFLPVRHGRTMLTGTMKKDGLSDALLVELKKKHPKSRAGMPSRAELYRMKESAQNISELHPLIDHDYCMFTEFSADIQSSIIATMDTKIKPERRSVKKAKVARTKLYQTPATQTKVDPKLKKRKYTKRKLNQLLQRVKGVMDEASGQIEGTDEKQSSVANNAPGSVFMSGQLKEKFRDRKPKRHYRPRNSGDKNYVKIPGSYQDEFVYYATKKQRGRPRKFEEEHQESAAKSGATSINEFEWYREMAKIDKGSKFGVAGVGTNNITKPNNLELLHKMPDYGHGANGSTPIQESDVVDMVIDMMPSSGLDVAPPMDSSNIFGVLMNNDVGHCENIPSDSHSKDSSASRLDAAASSSEQTESTVDPGVMAEFNRLLNSMEEAEQLKILVNLADGQASGEKQDKDNNGLCKADGDGMLNNLNAYLGSYSTEGHNAGSSLSVGQSQSQSQFLDLDEINDNDLLNTSELGNIFADLTTASNTSTTTSLAVMTTAGDGLQKMPDSDFANFADSSCSSYSMESGTVDLPNVDSQLPTADPPLTLGTMPSAFGRPLDKCELFPDISSTVPQVSSEFGVPDLTLVNMYWNELPGLLINGKEYVRLVDIHKQVLPAKDTGILKKRCQMMGLEIMNCSELQRDFLIRYMNAAKSKSCVIVAKEAAKTLIGFYVDPRPRMLNKQPAEPYIPTKSRTGPSKLKVLLPSRREPKVSINADDELATSDSVTSASSATSTTNSPAVASRTGKQKSRHVNATEDSSGPGTFVNSRRRHEVSMKDIKRSPRLRNKKVMYAALHNGGWAEEEEPARTLSPNAKGSTSDVNDSDVEPKVNVHPEGNVNVLEVPETDLKTTASKSKHLSAADDINLSELVARQMDCKLNLKERRRINRLQKKIRKHKLLSCHDEVELLEKWLRNLEKAKLRRLKKKAIADKYSLEHCYAANPEPQDQSIKSVKLETDSDVSGDTTEVKHQEETSVPSKHSTAVRISDHSPCNKTTKNSGTVPAESKSKSRLKMARLGNGEIQQTLQVVHMDSVQRSHGKRNHSQAGTLYLSKYQSREAACIECNTCHEMLSVRRFLKHRHHLNNPDELVEVSLPQKLELSPPPQADMRSDDVHLWAQFTQRRQTFSQLLPKRRHPSKVRASVKHRPVVHRIRNASRKRLEPVLDKNVINTENNNDTCKQDIIQSVSDVVNEAAPETAVLDDSSRHSGRVRKRKQLYPMESYVFGRSPRQGSPVTKRARYSVHFHGSPT